MRCFVAVELDRALRQPLERLLADHLPRTRDVRWCTPAQLHVTLKFLGEVEPGLLDQVCEIVAGAAAGVAPFDISLGTLGAFPSPARPRVLWCGVEDASQGCRRWVDLAEPRLASLGFAPETRRFHPHITLGRSRGPAGGRVMQRVLSSPPALPEAAMRVERLVLYESQLLPTGARYRVRFAAPLGGGVDHP